MTGTIKYDDLREGVTGIKDMIDDNADEIEALQESTDPDLSEAAADAFEALCHVEDKLDTLENKLSERSGS